MTGQLFNLGDPPTLKELVAISSLLGRYHKEKKIQLYVVTGGGETARKYIELARKHDATETQLDMMGITASRLNAQLLISLIGEAAFPNPLTSLEEMGPLVNGGKILVFSGILPGVSTNTVSALVAEMTRADLLITLSRPGCLYDKDPDTYEDAAPLEEATPDEVRRILSPLWERAGLYPLFDRTALNVISRSKIPTIITAPTASELEKALEGRKTGTRIVLKR